MMKGKGKEDQGPLEKRTEGEMSSLLGKRGKKTRKSPPAEGKRKISLYRGKKAWGAMFLSPKKKKKKRDRQSFFSGKKKGTVVFREQKKKPANPSLILPGQKKKDSPLLGAEKIRSALKKKKKRVLKRGKNNKRGYE